MSNHQNHFMAQATKEEFLIKRSIDGEGTLASIKIRVDNVQKTVSAEGKLSTKHISYDDDQHESLLSDWAEMWEEAITEVKRIREKWEKDPNQLKLPFAETEG